MQVADRREIINNALTAGPTIPFDRFSTLFKTWLEVLCNLSEDQRTAMFEAYIMEIARNPGKIILFNLDGILETYLSLTDDQKMTIASTVRKILGRLDDDSKRRIFLLIPERAMREIGF